MSENEIVLRYERGAVYVDHAPPVFWFDERELKPMQTPGWSFDGSLVTLNAANGRWVWKLTGKTYTRDYGPGTMPLVLLEGAWPD